MTTLLRGLVRIKYKNRLSQMQEVLKCRDVYLHLTYTTHRATHK